jgi:hypothetical protein
MERNNEDNTPQLQESSWWGLILILALVLGIPLLGILAKYLGY